MVGANNKRFRDEYRTAKVGWQSRGINTLERAAGSTGQIIENGVYVRDKHSDAYALHLRRGGPSERAVCSAAG